MSDSFAPRSDGQPVILEHSRAPEKMAADKVRCEACPVLCQISPGKLGACDRYGNVDGVLTRLDTLHLVARPGIDLVPWQAAQDGAWDGSLVAASGNDAPVFVSGIGSGTTYPDYKPAPFIVASKHAGVDLVTVVTEGIFSYCSFKVKVDTDRYLGPEQATVRHQGEAVGHVSTIEYGSQFLALGGVHHLTGGSKKEGRIACEMMMALGNRQPVELQIDGGARIVVAADKAPIVDGVAEERMRVGCGSATIGIFAQQWFGHVDEVVVVDDHITGVLSEHQAGQVPRHGAFGDPRSRPQVDAGALLPGRQPGLGLGRHRHHRPAGDRRIVGAEARRAARAAPAHGLDHRRGLRPGSSSTTTSCRARPRCRPRCAASSSASARTASPRSARCSSSPAPAGRCVPASPRTRSR